MRRSSFAFALLALAAVTAPAFAADAAMKMPWDGFGEGSFVMQKTTAKTAMTGAEPNESVSEGRQTLIKITEKAYTIKSETKAGEEWMPMEYDMPRVAAPASVKPTEAKVEDLGKETLTVDGESIECKKEKVTVAGSTTVTWTHEKYGAVKTESKGAAGDSTSELTKLKAVVKIKGKDVECRVFTTTMKSPQMEMTSSTWLSDTLPGGVARMESSTKMAMMSTTTVMETTDYEKK